MDLSAAPAAKVANLNVQRWDEVTKFEGRACAASAA
jgi:hypothetical protein